MEELASALLISGAPYTYLLNVSSKYLSTLGASLLLLDFTTTSVVTSATAASYLAWEVKLPFPSFVGAIFFLVILVAVGLSRVKESAWIVLVVLTMYISVFSFQGSQDKLNYFLIKCRCSQCWYWLLLLLLHQAE